MRDRWQFNIIFMVLLITSCYGGPVVPPKKNTTSHVVTAQAIKQTSDTPKLKEENPKPTVGANPSILNINFKYNNSTAASNNLVSQSAPNETNISGVPAVGNPSGSLPAENTAPDDASAGGQAKPEGDKQVEAGIVDNKTTVNATDIKVTENVETKVTENVETKVTESVATNEDKVSNITIQDEAKSGGNAEAVTKEKNTSDSGVKPTVPSETNIKSTYSEDKKSNTSESEAEVDKTEAKIVTLDSQNNGSKQNEKPSTLLDSNTQPEIKNPTIGSDSNIENDKLTTSTSTNNQEINADSSVITIPDNEKSSFNPESNVQTENKDFSIDSGSNIEVTVNEPSKTELPVQASKSEAADKVNAPTASSFDIKYGDDSPVYQQTSDSEYSDSSFYQYKNGMSSSNDMIDDDLPKENSIPNDDGRGPYDERQVYENPQNVIKGEFTSDEDSHFFAYFLTIMVLAIVFYLLFHNKQRVGQMCGCVKKNDRLTRIKQDKAKEPLLKSTES